ncbi:MAG: porin [Rhodothermales bacterium]
MKRTVMVLVMLLTSAGCSALAQQRALSTYGYVDLEFEATTKEGTHSTFDIHHFNVINTFRLDEHFRVFSEVEWEHGVDFSGSSGLGEIRLERAWVEYKYSDALKVRAGKFLTPYGIYNLLHDATPTFLSTFLPTSIYGKHRNPLGGKQRFYPKFASGVQVVGTYFYEDWKLDYSAYVANGRGRDPYKADDNHNKALGGRVIVGFPGESLEVGTSYFTERNGTADHARQHGFGFDAAFDHAAGLQLKSEAAFSRLERVDPDGAGTGVFQKALGVYGQAAYTLADRLTPFVRYDYFDPNTDRADDEEIDVTLGVNFSATARVYLKTEVHFKHFRNDDVASYTLFVSSVAVAF